MTDERYWGAGNCRDCIQPVTQVRVLDVRGNVLVDWTRWQRTLTLPYLPGEPVTVEYFDGRIVLPTVVDPAVDFALLPGYVPSAPMPTPEVTDVREPDIQPTDTPTVILPTDTPAVIPLAEAPAADVLLVYDEHSLTLINVAARSLFLPGLEFTCGGVSLPVEEWDTPYLYSDLAAFPPGHCLQVWSYAEGREFPPPPRCVSRDAWITTQANAVFWTDCDFEVRQYGALLTGCSAGAGECAVNLP